MTASRLTVSHRTRYVYSQPVALEQHTLRLRPRSDGLQRVASFDIAFTPQPAAVAEFVDAEGNSATHVWFQAPTPTFEIFMRTSVDTWLKDPFAFRVPESAARVPFPTEGVVPFILRPYCDGPPIEPEVVAFAEGVAQAAGNNTLGFLLGLATSIHADHEAITRLEGGPWEPAKTLHAKEGACRDFSVLFMAACRVFNVPTRFVSGYHLGVRERDRWDLHAWVEAFMPGVGWRGFDPTVGLAVADRHVALAAARDPADAAPVVGNFQGSSGVTSQLTYNVHVTGGGNVT